MVKKKKKNVISKPNQSSFQPRAQGKSFPCAGVLLGEAQRQKVRRKVLKLLFGVMQNVLSTGRRCTDFVASGKLFLFLRVDVDYHLSLTIVCPWEKNV